MNDTFHRLAARLLEKNDQLTYDEARTWVEILWEDFEATRAKAGRQFVNHAVTEKIVTQWINYYGPMFHEIVASNPKFQKLIKDRDFNNPKDINKEN
ncbi:WVELL protein [Scopulibacillus darangshiensis]|uniref:WVELL protein n=1 Tax=Scopulibacillus darangshiensis TaxID=442528 RepID=A0A4R2NKW0_9BACL|nr:YfhJ family protein [Scopulibacillus darangshiensis]TCP22131.1 WVELL protein [Scopulibacillus darangshiensis]